MDPQLSSSGHTQRDNSLFISVLFPLRVAHGLACRVFGDFLAAFWALTAGDRQDGGAGYPLATHSEEPFSGIGGSTGIDIQSGVSDAYNIIGNVFNGAGTYLSDGGTGSNKNIVGNVPGVASNLSSPLLRLDAQTQFVDTGTKPSCGVSNRFVLWVEEGGSGIKDAVEICAKNSSNSYGWRVIY